MKSRACVILRLPMVALLAMGLTFSIDHEPFGDISAWAQDDGGGGDDGDDGGGGGGGASGGSGGSSAGGGSGRALFQIFKQKRAKKKRVQRRAVRTKQVRKAAPRNRATRARVVQQAALPERAANEIVALGLSDDQLDTLESRGYVIVQQDDVAAIGARIARLRVPRGTGLEAARAEVGAINAQATADFNHYYREGQEDGCAGGHCAATELIGWPVEAGLPKSCDGAGASLRIGMIDTGINPQHDTFKGRTIEVLKTAPQELFSSGAQHGTAVAAILVGSGQSRTPGLLGNATLIAVDSFHRDGGDERSDLYALIKAMDMLATRNVSVINMSMAGPPNTVLEKMVDRLYAMNVAMVASAGNSGPKSAPAYPAAYQPVIAATAVDRSKRVYRRAVQGDHIDFAAPGVSVWTAASVSGGRAKTGTSFAAPFVTAAVALAKLGKPQAGPDELIGELAGQAVDLGDAGKDPVFGHGLVQVARLCPAGPQSGQ